MRKRTDHNHQTIINELKNIGFTVMDLSSVGKGCPDIMAGFRGKNYLFEIKNPLKSKSQRKLTKDQELFHGTWRGQVHVITCLEDIVSNDISFK